MPLLICIQESLFCSSHVLFSPVCFQISLFGSPAPSIQSPCFTWFLLHIYTSVHSSRKHFRSCHLVFCQFLLFLLSLSMPVLPSPCAVSLFIKSYFSPTMVPVRLHSGVLRHTSPDSITSADRGISPFRFSTPSLTSNTCALFHKFWLGCVPDNYSSALFHM
ncbi:hypothetical protein ILYODFUR_032697 [Ilyodon furcidens]|uniref:Uncharacterized protein n=1 Tax=Ilyodon furcidens TaxID=33524 RepID=A0ABV0UX58_9TELE